MANYLYNDIELPEIPASASPVAVISAVLESASSMFGGASYIVTFGSSILWSGGKCYVRGITGVYRYNGSAWVWHYGSGTTYTQDIIASGYFEAIWTNTNIPTADGVSVYLAKTDPVPVGGESGGEEETPGTPEYTIDDVIKARREGFITGLLTGLSIKGVLHKKSIVEPVEADFYLYGTPSESGNVALADGEGYVLYNGAVLPKLPEWDKAAYPYAVLNRSSSGVISLNCIQNPCLYGAYTFVDNNGETWNMPAAPHTTFPAGKITLFCQYLLTDNAWGDATVYTYDFISKTVDTKLAFTEIIWTNTDIPNIDTNGTYLAKSDPIPLASSEPVAAVYEDMKWDVASYPYACYGSNLWGNTLFIYSKTPCEYYTNGYVMAGVVYQLTDGQWEYYYDSSNNTGGARTAIIPKWSNHDLYDADGNLYLAASAPVYIYEQKE